jgi:integrase/recombinase XerD
LSKSTINTRLATVSSFFRFAARYEVEPGRYLHVFNPALAVERYHIQPYEHAKQGLTIAQVKQLLAACDRTTPIGARDFAILLFYIYTARRRNELLGIHWSDIREGGMPGTKEYRYRGKGGKGGWRTLPQPVWEAIKEYLQIAGRLASITDDSVLFVPTNDHAARLGYFVNLEDIDRKPLNETTVNKIVKRAAGRAGLSNVTVHTLRYTAAQLRRKSGDSIDEISDLLDHANSGITKLYLAAVEGKDDTSWQNIAKLLDEQQ